jgi:predicted helicase
MSTVDVERLRSIKTFPSLVKYLRDELDWPIESDDFDELTFDYEPEELGLDAKTAVNIKDIKQLRPLTSNQPWGIFFINFEPKRLPVVVLRRILRALVLKKRRSANKAQQATWNLHDLLFISSYGESDHRDITFAHFAEEDGTGDLPTLRVLGWDDEDTVLHLGHADKILREKLRWPEAKDIEEWRSRWSSAFTLRPREVIGTSKALAERMAELATAIRKRVNKVLAVESEAGALRKLMKAFREALIHDLNEDDFADMYAQTITYGLLTARVSRPAGLVAQNVADMVPITNPFLRDMLSTFLTVGGRKGKIDFDELGINEVVQALRDADMEAVMRDFGDKNPQEDPVIHFYEDFLKEYDAKKRIQRGVFFTPRSVVSFIVRSVDEILRKEFGLEDGLADTATWVEMAKRHKDLKIPAGVKPDEPFVKILDPACGTGTFLVEVIGLIYQTMRSKWLKQGHMPLELQNLWSEYVSEHLLPRLYGFELMMAPYAIAHMKLGLKLHETQYDFRSHERARIYLTNTLEEPKDFSDRFEFDAPALAHEAHAVNAVKRNQRFTVVIGNPPYSKLSLNWNEWIDALLHGEGTGAAASSNYYMVDGAPLGERTVWIQDDYIKFIRFSQWEIDRSGTGIHSYISNNGYLDNPTLRGMRQQLKNSFRQIHVLDLHGSSKRGERGPENESDKNVFDIQQGVAIGLFAKMPSDTPLSVLHGDLWGSRESKYQILSSRQLSDLPWTTVNSASPSHLFIPIDSTYQEEFDSGWKVTDIFAAYHSGIITKRDSLTIHWTEHDLLRTVRDFAALSPTAAKEKYNLPDDVRDWKVKWAQSDLKKAGFSKERAIPVLYRPFDVRFTYFTGNSRGFVGWPVAEMTELMLPGDNVALVTTRMTKGEDFGHVLISRHMVEVICLSAKTSNNGFLFPLYSNPTAGSLPFRGPAARDQHQARVPNLKPTFWNRLSSQLGIENSSKTLEGVSCQLSVENLFHYVVAILGCPSYRMRYSELLCREFPRIPLPGSVGIFDALAVKGADLVAVHLLEDKYPMASWNVSRPKGKCPLESLITKFGGKGDPEVAKGYPKYAAGKVFINPTRWFEGVPEKVWNFHIGGYQVCEKWLKSRRGRTLSHEDILHYQRVVVALNETIRLMAEIDKVIEAHGGWPGAFATGKADKAEGQTK